MTLNAREREALSNKKYYLKNSDSILKKQALRRRNKTRNKATEQATRQYKKEYYIKNKVRIRANILKYKQLQWLKINAIYREKKPKHLVILTEKEQALSNQIAFIDKSNKIKEARAKLINKLNQKSMYRFKYV